MLEKDDDVEDKKPDALVCSQRGSPVRGKGRELSTRTLK